MKQFLPIIILTAIAGNVFSARILAVVPFYGKSHHIFLSSVYKTLVTGGHEVVSYSPFPIDKPMANYTVVHLDSLEPADKSMTPEQFKMFMTSSGIETAKRLWMFSTKIVGDLFQSNKFQDLLKSNEKFDLIIVETFFAQEMLVALGHRFKAPVISLLPFGTFSIVNKAAGNPLNLAYIPDLALPYSDQMSFYERATNAYSVLSSLYFYYTNYLPSQEKIMRSMFNDPTMPSLVDMIANISLIFNNLHPYVQYAQTNTPNLVPIGGIHLANEKKPLPPAMQKFLDDAKHGVIYLSLGTVIPDHVLGKEYFDKFINVFRKLPQRVLWKTNSEFQDLPNNIMTVKWAPQQDLLAHPNVVVFMTHGGLLSQHEAIHAGVPVVCTPYFGDQPANAKFYEKREIGVRLLFNDLSEDTIHSALSAVINDPKYKNNMARLSKIYRDRPISPAESVVYWVEYVLRHRGAHHLKPASVTMPWYQLILLDVLAVLFIAITMVILVIYIVIKKILSALFGSKQGKVTSRNKKRD